jgi:hypothetical protein
MGEVGWNLEMTPEVFIGIMLTGMVATIGYFLQSLVTELRQTNKEHGRHIIDILERLVRLEERNAANR